MAIRLKRGVRRSLIAIFGAATVVGGGYAGISALIGIGGTNDSAKWDVYDVSCKVDDKLIIGGFRIPKGTTNYADDGMVTFWTKPDDKKTIVNVHSCMIAMTGPAKG